MKLVFDAHWWVDGPTANRHVLREMVHGWSRRFPDDELVLVTRADQTPDLDTTLSGPVSVFQYAGVLTQSRPTEPVPLRTGSTRTPS